MYRDPELTRLQAELQEEKVDKADFESSIRICNMVENAQHEYEGNYDDFFWSHQINLKGEIIRRDDLEPTYRPCG